MSKLSRTMKPRINARLRVGASRIWTPEDAKRPGIPDLRVKPFRDDPNFRISQNHQRNPERSASTRATRINVPQTHIAINYRTPIDSHNRTYVAINCRLPKIQDVQSFSVTPKIPINAENFPGMRGDFFLIILLSHRNYSEHSLSNYVLT